MRTVTCRADLPDACRAALEQIGKPIPRPDAVDKVTGQAMYSDDYLFAEMLHGATLRSEHPHARILGHRCQRGPGTARRYCCAHAS
jgi:CO/xanthine dehydrogenase Mo-binding subunit